MITHRLEVLIGRDKPDTAVSIKRCDSGVRLEIYLHQKKKFSKYITTDEAYIIPAGSTAILKVEKLDKKLVMQKGKSCSGSTATFELDPQALTVVGMNPAEVHIYGPDGRRITTATFHIDVLPELGEGCTEDSETHVDIISEQLQRAEEAAKRAEDAADRAEGAGGGGSGVPGYSPTVEIEETDNGHKVSITDVNGKKEFEVKNGKDGKNGVDGKDGSKGDKGDKGDAFTYEDFTAEQLESLKGKDGKDYVFTEADKAEIIDGVLAALPKYNGEVIAV